QGIQQVMAPLATATCQLWTSGHGFAWILYPFVEGHNGFETALSDAQWIALGRSLKAVHTTTLPLALGWRGPREAYCPRWPDLVEEFDQQVETRTYNDAIAGRLAAFWVTKRSEIQAMVARADQLAQALRDRRDALVLCHTDLHAGNVLLGASDEL